MDFVRSARMALTINANFAGSDSRNVQTIAVHLYSRGPYAAFPCNYQTPRKNITPSCVFRLPSVILLNIREHFLKSSAVCV